MQNTQPHPSDPYSSLPEPYSNLPEPHTYTNPYIYVPPTTEKPSELDGPVPRTDIVDVLPVANKKKWWKRYAVLLAVLAVVIVGAAVGGGVGGALSSQKKKNQNVSVLETGTGTFAGAAGYVYLFRVLELSFEGLRNGYV